MRGGYAPVRGSTKIVARGQKSGPAAYSDVRRCLVSLQSAHVLPVWMSTFSGTVKPVGVASIASTTIWRVSSTN